MPCLQNSWECLTCCYVAIMLIWSKNFVSFVALAHFWIWYPPLLACNCTNLFLKGSPFCSVYRALLRSCFINVYSMCYKGKNYKKKKVSHSFYLSFLSLILWNEFHELGPVLPSQRKIKIIHPPCDLHCPQEGMKTHKPFYLNEWRELFPTE